MPTPAAPGELVPLWLIVKRWDGKRRWLESINVDDRPSPSIAAHGIAGTGSHWIEVADDDPLEPPLDDEIRDALDRWTTNGIGR